MSDLAFNPRLFSTNSNAIAAFSNANRTITATPAAIGAGVGVHGWGDFIVRGRETQRKWYFEFVIGSDGIYTDVDVAFGISDIGIFDTSNYWGRCSLVCSHVSFGLSSRIFCGEGSSARVTGLPNLEVGDVVMVAVDNTGHPASNRRKIWFGKNGTWFNSGDPAAGTNPTYQGGGGIPASTDDYIMRSQSDSSGAKIYQRQAWTAHAAAYHSTITSRFKASELEYTPPTGFTAFDDIATRPAIINSIDYSMGGGNIRRTDNSRIAIPYEAQFQLFPIQLPRNSSAGGKYYFEVEIYPTTEKLTAVWPEIGIVNDPDYDTSSSKIWERTGCYGIRDQDKGTSNEIIYGASNSSTAYTGSLPYEGNTTFDRYIMQCAVDFTAGLIWFGINNVWLNSGDPAAGSGYLNVSLLIPTGVVFYPAVRVEKSTVSSNWSPIEPIMNEGDFIYTPPSGFRAWGGIITEAEFAEALSSVDVLSVTTVVNELMAETLESLMTLSVTSASNVGWSESLDAAFTTMGEVVMSASMTEAAAFTDTMAANGVFVAEWTDNVLFVSTLNLGADEIVAWAITIDRAPGEQQAFPAGRYDHYGFDDFLEIDGELLGLGEEGIYKLNDTTDDGDEILATAVLPRVPLGADRDQRISMLYVLGKSGGNVTVRVVDQDDAGNETAYDYETELPPGARLNMRRVKVGRGLRSGEWSLVVENQEGEYTEIHDVLAKPVVLRRRRGGDND